MRVISLFCGCGGMDLGFLGGFVYLSRRYAGTGASVVLAVDKDPEACALYRANIGPVLLADIRDIRDWPEADILIGGPPCQPFSAAGKRIGGKDPRDMMPAFFQVLDRVRPRIFLLENVAGLARRRGFIDYFRGLLERASKMGYQVSYRVLDAADYGVPQRRERLFIIGSRPGLAPDSLFPPPTYGEIAGRPHRTVREALHDMHIPLHTHPLRSLKEGERRHPKFGASSRRLRADAPFPTIKAVDTQAKRLIHPWYDRYLVMAELLRGQSFPDRFIVPKRTPAVGNAVPPLLAWHLARRIIKGMKKG